MIKYIYIFLTLLITITFSACGSENSELSSQSNGVATPMASAPLNKEAITFPNLPTASTTVPSTYEIEQK